MNKTFIRTMHLVQAGERITIDIYDAELEIAVREPETSLIRHLYNAWRLADGLGVAPSAQIFSAFKLAMNHEHLRYIFCANVGWPYSIEKRTAGLRTYENLDTTRLRNSRLAVVLAECEDSKQAAYEGITEVAGGDEVLYRRACLPVLGDDGNVSAVYVILRPLHGDCLTVPWKEASDAARG